MTELNVPPEWPKREEREEVAVAKLERGAWIQLVDEEGEMRGDVHVLHVETYDDRFSRRRAVIVYRHPGGQPESIDFDAAMTVPLLTDDEIGALRDRERRLMIADQLRAVADLILRDDVPLPSVHTPVLVELAYRDVEVVAALAALLGVRTHEAGPSQVFMTRQTDGDSGAGVNLQAVAHREWPPTPDPTGDAYSDLADRLNAEVVPVPDSVRGLGVDGTGEFGVVHPAATDGGLVDPHVLCVDEHDVCPRREAVVETRRLRGAS